MGLLFTLSMTYGGAFVSLFRPYYGFLIYVCFAIIKPPALWHWSVPAGNYSRIIGVALLLGWALHGGGDWKLGRSRRMLLCLLALLFWTTLSTAFSPAPAPGWASVENLVKIVLPFMVGLTLITSKDDIRKLVWVICLSTGYVAVEYNRNYYNGGDADRFLAMDANVLSILLIPGCGLAFYFGLFVQHGWRRWLLFLISTLIAHVPMAGASRGGMMGLIVLGGVGFLLLPKTFRFLCFYGLAGASGLWLAGPSVVDEFETVFTDTNELENKEYGRLFMWQACFTEMMKHPILGCGQDRWGLVAPDYGYPPGKEAHSLWAQTAAELGVPGISLLAGFYLATIWSMWRLSRRETDPDWQAVGRMVILGLVGFMVSASFVTVEGLEIPYYTALAGAAALKLSDAASKLAGNQGTLMPVGWATPSQWNLRASPNGGR